MMFIVLFLKQTKGLGQSLIGKLSQPSVCGLRDQNMADCSTWNSSSLSTLQALHVKCKSDYGCSEWAPAPASDANAQAPENDDETVGQRESDREKERERERERENFIGIHD